MAVEVHSFRAHVSGAGLLPKADEFGKRVFEVRGEHVVRIIAEAVIAQREVRRVRERFLPAPTQFFHPDVPGSSFRQGIRQRLSVEVRQSARHWESTNIKEGLNGVCTKGFDQLFQTARGMADGEESGHEGLSFSGNRQTDPSSSNNNHSRTSRSLICPLCRAIGLRSGPLRDPETECWPSSASAQLSHTSLSE